MFGLWSLNYEYGANGMSFLIDFSSGLGRTAPSGTLRLTGSAHPGGHTSARVEPPIIPRGLTSGPTTWMLRF